MNQYDTIQTSSYSNTVEYFINKNDDYNFNCNETSRQIEPQAYTIRPTNGPYDSSKHTMWRKSNSILFAATGKGGFTMSDAMCRVLFIQLELFLGVLLLFGKQCSLFRT